MNYCPFCNWPIVAGKCSGDRMQCGYVGAGVTEAERGTQYKEERTSGGRDPSSDPWYGEHDD